MKRTPGRPPLDDEDDSTGVYVRMPTRQYDQLYERVQRERLSSVPELIRRELRHPAPSNKNM